MNRRCNIWLNPTYHKAVKTKRNFIKLIDKLLHKQQTTEDIQYKHNQNKLVTQLTGAVE